MNRVLTALCGAALLTLGTHAENSPEAAAPITIYTNFENDPPDFPVEAMKTELSEIMTPVGLDFEWRSLNGSRGNEVSIELVVVSFKGNCEWQDEVPHRESGALGWTHMSDGDVLPFSDVDCNRVRRFIAPLVAGANKHERERIFGRALGRVLAHELYHVFANTTHHAAVGVAKAFYTPGELVSDSFHFQDKEGRQLRSGKLRSLVHQPIAHAGGGR